jgi:hypothetical protein
MPYHYEFQIKKLLEGTDFVTDFRRNRVIQRMDDVATSSSHQISQR